MTVKEAINQINHICEGCKDLKVDNCDECVYPLAIKVLEKQIPKKPYKVTSSLYHCKECGTLIRTLDKFNDNYCDHCGQKIDWSEEK